MEQFHPLDRLINDNSFSLLEALVPFVDYPYKQWLVLFIKYKEAMALINCFNDKSYVSNQGFDCHPKTTEEFVTALCKILPNQYADTLNNMKQMMQVMQMMDMGNLNGVSNVTQKNKSAPGCNLYSSVMDILNDNY